MSTPLSIPDVVARLEAQAALHKEREAFHSQQEAFHRDQRAAHAAELERVSKNLEAFKAAAASAVDLAGRPAPLVATESESLGPGRPKLARMVAQVVRGFGASERFGTKRVTQEIEARFRDVLRGPVDAKLVSITLRRMADAGRIHQVRRGRPHWEALYAKEKPAAAP